MSLAAILDLEKMIQFYEGSFGDDHEADRIIMPKYPKFSAGLLNWLNVPSKATGLYHMKEAVDCLIQAYKRETEEILSPDFDLFYQQFWTSMDEDDIKGDGTSLDILNGSVQGTIGTNPVFAFLFLSCAHGGASKVSSDGLLVSFTSFGPYFFQKINKYKQTYSHTFLDRLCLVARKLIVSAPDLTSNGRFTPNQTDKEQIGYTALSIVDAELPSIFEISNRTYVFDLLFREGRKEVTKDQYRKEGGNSTKSRWKEYADGFRFAKPVDYPEAVNHRSFFKVTNKKRSIKSTYLVGNKMLDASQSALLKSGETLFDYVEDEGLEIPAEFFIDPWKAKRGEAQKIEALAFSSSPLLWEKDVLSKPVIRRLLNIIQTQSKQVRSIICLSLLMGLKEKQLRNMHMNVLPEDREDSGVELVKSLYAGLNYSAENKLLWEYHLANSRSDKFIQLQPQKKIILPESIYKWLPTQERGEKLFSASSFIETKRILKKLGTDGVAEVTLSRLAKTFEAYAIQSFGLPILFTDILSGDSRAYLRSQHHYVTQDLKHLTKQWHLFIESFLSEYMDKQLLNFRYAPVKPFQVARYKMSSEKESVGAVNTPQKQSLKKHFQSLFGMFPHKEEQLVRANVHQWNAYIAYLYGMFSVCTGQRPRRDPVPELNEVCLKKGIIHITDKNSHYHQEERCVPLVNILLNALIAHKKILPKWRAKIISEGNFVMPAHPCFFPVIEIKESKIVNARPWLLDHVLCEHTDLAYIKGMKNGYRHFLLTALFHDGVNQYDIDWVSGHRRRGLEAESVFSPCSWKSMAEKMKANIEESVVKPLALQEPVDG